MWRWVFHAAVLGCTASLGSAHAQTGGAEPIVRLVDSYNASSAATFALPMPDDDQLERLRSGEVVAFRNRVPMGSDEQWVYRVVALAAVPEDRLRLWVATLGSAEQNAKRMVEIKIDQLDAGAAVWYQFVNLPWPIADRHWTIRSQARTGVAETTGAWWEHGWTLAERGLERARDRVEAGTAADLTARQFERAVYLPMNDGGWLMARLPDGGTLVAVHATAELGGGLPDSWVARYVSRKLRNLVGQIRARAGQAEAILAASPLIFTGHGERIETDLLEDGGSTCRSNNRC